MKVFETRAKKNMDGKIVAKIYKTLTPNQRVRFMVRIKALVKLGGSCKRCRFGDPRALQIDHVNGLESKPRQSIYRIQQAILAHPGIHPDFQVLCANCNWIKRYDNYEVKWSRFRPL